MSFLKNHPIQPNYIQDRHLPFKPQIYMRKITSGELIQRSWLSYSVSLKKLFCSICMIFSKIKTNFNSVGVSDFRHIFQRVSEHECSSSHTNAVNAYFQAQNEKNIECRINLDLQRIKKNEIENNRLILKRIIDIILFIAKQGLAYRGKNESSALLCVNNFEIKRGNFLELCLLLSNYDNILKNHIQKVSKIAQEQNKSKSSKGRGNSVTFLSKTIINRIILIISNELKNKIAQEISDAKKFSIQMDSTQDVTSSEQCSIICRYVKDSVVYERLIAFVEVKKSTGLALHNLLAEELGKKDLKMENIIGCSFDGAANMSGQYNGLQAHLKNINPNIVHTWCYAHVLNLVVCDTTESCLASINLFGLLNRTSCYISDSYKRMIIWKEKLGENNLKRLKKICSTRWWSKARALEVLFGSYFDQKNETYSTILIVLFSIHTSNEFDSKSRSEAKSLLDSFTKFETVVVAFTYLRLFQFLTPASNYLQTKGLNFQQAFLIIENAKKSIKQMLNQYNEIIDTATKFIDNINEKHIIIETNILIDTDFPVMRQRTKKKLPGELSNDEISVINDMGPLKKFEIECYKIIINQVIQSLDLRFSKHEDIYKDFCYFDPSTFKDTAAACGKNLPENALVSVTNLSGLKVDKLKQELISFAQNYANLKKQKLKTEQTPSSSLTSSSSSESSDDEDDDEVNEAKVYRNTTPHNNQTNNHECAGCIHCCLLILYKYNLHSLAYTNLYIAYKYLLTLSCTQVSCERSFSKLKVIKTKLRSALQQDLLEAFMLMNTEIDLLQDINYDQIIDILGKSSNLLTAKLLI